MYKEGYYFGEIMCRQEMFSVYLTVYNFIEEIHTPYWEGNLQPPPECSKNREKHVESNMPQ